MPNIFRLKPILGWDDVVLVERCDKVFKFSSGPVELFESKLNEAFASLGVKCC